MSTTVTEDDGPGGTGGTGGTGVAGTSGTPGQLRLLGVEWLRLRSRRAFVALVLLALVGLGVMVGSLTLDARPPSAAEIAAAEDAAAREAEQPYVQEQIDQCEEAQAAGDETMFGPGFDCAELVPRADWFYYQEVVDFVPASSDVLVQSVSMLGLAALLIGATFAGADWSAGTIGTQLLFEPRRGRVFAAKTLVVALAMGVTTVVALAGAGAAVYAIASAWGSTDGTGDARGDLLLAGLRGVAAVAGAGALGVALGLAFRRSIAVLGLVFAYLFLGEGLLRGFSSGVEPWLVSSRLLAWLQGGFDVYQYPSACNSGPCEPVVTHISTPGGGLFLAVLLGVLILGSYAVFRTRDVG